MSSALFFTYFLRFIDHDIPTHNSTGEKRHVCPHVIGCDQESKKLCGYATHTEWILLQHRRHEHGFIGAANVTKHPWVKNANISLSAAKLCLGNPQSAPLDHGETAVYDNHPRVYHVQEPPIPAPSNALGLIHEPTPSNSDSATRLPIQETPTPLRSRLDSAPFYRHIPCYRMHPYKQPDNSTADHRTEGRTKVINNFRYHRLVSSGEFGFHPVLKEWFELPKWENDGALDQVQLERIIPLPRATATNPSTDDWPYIP